MENEAIFEVRKWGNSAGVLVSREWLGKQVKVTLIDRSKEVKKEVFEILNDYMDDLHGIYLCGSYARGEQREDSDIDIVAISGKSQAKISSGKYNIEIYTLDSVKKTLGSNPLIIYPRLREAKIILNKNLLEELLSIKLDIRSFKTYLEDCKRIFKINKGLINLEDEGSKLDSAGILYSLILRARGLYYLKIILKRETYSQRKFEKWLAEGLDVSSEEVRKIYQAYRDVRDKKKVKDVFLVDLGRKLIAFLEEEVSKYGKKK